MGERIQKYDLFTAVLINLPVDAVVTLSQQNIAAESGTMHPATKNAAGRLVPAIVAHSSRTIATAAQRVTTEFA